MKKIKALEIPKMKGIINLLNEIHSIKHTTTLKAGDRQISLELVKNPNKFIAIWPEGNIGKWQIMCSDYLLYFSEQFKIDMELIRKEMEIDFFCCYLTSIGIHSIITNKKQYVIR
jgi:hypothetical protein